MSFARLNIKDEMNENTDNNKNNDTMNRWYKSAVSSAVVAACFSFVVLVLLFANFVRSSIVEAKQEQELINLKAEIVKTPGDEQQTFKTNLRYTTLDHWPKRPPSIGLA